MSKVTRETYECVGRAPEPGDILLRGESGTEVYLQITEAVDVHRIMTNRQRTDYGTMLWTLDPALVKLFSGVQVALLDAGEVRDFPSLTSAKASSILLELHAELKSLAYNVNSLPENSAGQFRGKETSISLPSIALRLNVRLLRYAPAQNSQPPKWLWTGTHQVRPGDILDRFTTIILRKLTQYAKIQSPFWLVAYSVDCQCDGEEENAIGDLLAAQNKVFDKIYLFFPRPSAEGEIREVFPDRREVPVSARQSKKKVLFQFLPEDAVPKWNDPRWRSVGPKFDLGQ